MMDKETYPANMLASIEKEISRVKIKIEEIEKLISGKIYCPQCDSSVFETILSEDFVSDLFSYELLFAELYVASAFKSHCLVDIRIKRIKDFFPCGPTSEQIDEIKYLADQISDTNLELFLISRYMEHTALQVDQCCGIYTRKNRECRLHFYKKTLELIVEKDTI